MGRKVTESSLKNFRLVDVKSESSSSVHFHSMFMQTGVKNRKEQRGLARWPQKALPVLPELWVKRRRPSSSHMPCEGHGEKLRIQSQGAATVRAGGPHCRDVMSQPVLSPGRGCRWDSEDPRMEVELNQWWRDDGQAPNHLLTMRTSHAQTPGCIISTVFSVSSKEHRRGHQGPHKQQLPASHCPDNTRSSLDIQVQPQLAREKGKT